MAFHIKLNAQPMLGWISQPKICNRKVHKLPTRMVA
jgi:hypothetical protein